MQMRVRGAPRADEEQRNDLKQINSLVLLNMSSELAALEARVSSLEAKLENVLFERNRRSGHWLSFDMFFESRLTASPDTLCQDSESAKSCPSNVASPTKSVSTNGNKQSSPPFGLLAFRGRGGGKSKKVDSSSHIFLVVAEHNQLRFTGEDDEMNVVYNAGDAEVEALFVSSNGEQILTLSKEEGLRIHDLVVTYRGRFFAGSREPLRRRRRGKLPSLTDSDVDSSASVPLADAISPSPANPGRHAKPESPLSAKLKLEVEFSGTHIPLDGEITAVAFHAFRRHPYLILGDGDGNVHVHLANGTKLSSTSMSPVDAPDSGGLGTAFDKSREPPAYVYFRASIFATNTICPRFRSCS